jgi:RNA polymerase sigma factor (sigma-70 family)
MSSIATIDVEVGEAGTPAIWHYGGTAMHPREMFETHLDVIEHAIRRVCHDARIFGPDEEDFASVVKLALLANEGAILGKYEGRSSFGTYITIVIRRLLIDQRRAEGRWYASAEAKRRGEAAILLDQLLHRDRNTFAEAAAIVAARHPNVTASELREIAAVLPQRAVRPRLVQIDEQDEHHFAASESAEERVVARDLEERSASINRAMETALASLSAQDRVVLRLRYAKGASIADIARALGLEQRPLYRRVDTLLEQLRRSLREAGFDASSVADVIGGAGKPLDFGLRPDDIAGGTS